jgi:hypothetical protein
VTFLLIVKYSLTDFVNLKIKLFQFFKCAHKSGMCKHVFIEMSIYIYMYKYMCLY